MMNFSNGSLKVPESQKKFTWKDLSKLNGISNAHVAYKGKVYDVSSFVSNHPGGVEQILAGAGRDITQVFNCYHKKDTFERVLSKYYVGELIDNEKPVFINESDFYGTVKKRVEKHMKIHNLDPKIDNGMFLTYFVILSLYFSSMCLSLNFYYIPLVCLFSTAVWANVTTIIGHTLYHDASHFAITHKPWVWKILMTLAASLTGVASINWRYSHVFGHHIHTNIDGFDPDINTAKESSKAVWRIKKSQKWSSRFIYQHVYMPVLYCILFIKLRLQDFRFVVVLNKDGIRMNSLTFGQWIQFLVEKSCHLFIRYLIPYTLLPLSSLILINIVFEVVSGVTLAQISLLNHVTDQVTWPVPDEKNEIYKDWAELQVMSTYDYCTDSWFWTKYTGSMNHQTAHHLFPGFNQSHYRWITPIIKQTSAEFGVKYHCMNSVMDMLKMHYGYLKFMGSNLGK